MYHACYALPKVGAAGWLHPILGGEGQSYAAICTGSGAIFGGNRARNASSRGGVQKVTQDEWRVASGTHATRLNQAPIADGQPMYG